MDEALVVGLILDARTNQAVARIGVAAVCQVASFLLRANRNLLCSDRARYRPA